MNTTIASKVAYVKGKGQTRDHHCHWPGCPEQTPPAKWGCTRHWFKLPKDLRDRIWLTFDPGQEVNGTPSTAYLAAARAVQDWIGAAAPVPVGPRLVTLVDGRQVDNASEDWRHECEARHVAELPSRERRQAYITAVRDRRGAAAGQQLEALAMRIYTAERQKGRT
jgi:hypothetical protein